MMSSLGWLGFKDNQTACLSFKKILGFEPIFRMTWMAAIAKECFN
ncbi:MAG: hypothetical protein ACAF41_27940 [Leptolyngbya sp. BL-A-14]